MREAWQDFVIEGWSWREYVTTLPWGRHPAGTRCRARRKDGFTVVLLFDDGTQVEARGYYRKGLEDPPVNSILARAVTLAHEEVVALEDERVFKTIEEVRTDVGTT